MMRTLWLLVLLVGCSNGGPKWIGCESWEDCPAEWGCARYSGGPGYCVLLCEDDGVCDALFGDTGPDSETGCSTPADCSPDDTLCSCRGNDSPLLCETDRDCANPAFPHLNTCLGGECVSCGYLGCGLYRCNDDSDCAGARCVAGTCRP